MSTKPRNRTVAHSQSIQLDDPTFKRLFLKGLSLPNDERRGLVILIRGKPGTGKSTLALQLLEQMSTAPPISGKYYCTLEQSKEDLKHKMAAILVEQALNEAYLPEYHPTDSNQSLFQYQYGRIENYLKSKLGNRAVAFLPENVFKRNKPKGSPLFGGESKPKDERLLRRELCKIVVSNFRGLKIEVQDETACHGEKTSEAPFLGFRSRVITAEKVIHKLIDNKPWKLPMGEKGAAPRDSRPVVVLDGLSLLSVSERETIGLQCLVELMRRRFKISMLVYEPADNESDSLDHQADMVIQLNRRMIDHPLPYLIHEFCIRKSRYQEAALGNHQFKIRGSGIAIFPSLHFQVHHPNYMELELKRSGGVILTESERQSNPTIEWLPAKPQDKNDREINSGSLIDLIFNPQKGESVVLLGSRNSFKTQISLDFLSRGSWGCPADCRKKDLQRGLLISLIDNAPDIERGLQCPWKSSLATARKKYCKARDCKKEMLTHARAFCQRPGCITPAEFFHYTKERIHPSKLNLEDKHLVERVVFWDLTQMDYRFPLFREDRMLLPALFDTFKTMELKSLFMGAGNAENTNAASAMADHVLFCWRSQFTPEENPEMKERKEVAESEHGSYSSLFLYVDRTSGLPGKREKSGKELYRIAINNEGRLEIPMSRGELADAMVKLSGLEKWPTDLKQIKRITNMQGVG